MPRYPPQPLEQKLAWLRERVRRRAEAEPDERVEPQGQGDSAKGRGAVIRRSISPERHRRQQRQAEETPAHLWMFRPKEVAELLGVSPDTVRRQFENRAVIIGQSVSTKSRRRKRIFLISLRDLEQWLDEHRACPKGKTRHA